MLYLNESFPHGAVVVYMVLCESGFSLIATRIRTCILHIIRHLVDLLRIAFGMRGIGFLRKTFSLAWPGWGLFRGDICLPNNYNRYI